MTRVSSADEGEQGQVTLIYINTSFRGQWRAARRRVNERCSVGGGAGRPRPDAGRRTPGRPVPPNHASQENTPRNAPGLCYMKIIVATRQLTDRQQNYLRKIRVDVLFCCSKLS